MSFRHIEVERRGAIEIIRLNRPRYRNAQSRLMLEEMTKAFAAADRDNEVKVVVLAGAGDHFSAGHDLGTPEEVADWETNPWGEGVIARVQRSWTLYVDYSLRWRDLKKPTIAAVQGYCIYGGYLIATCMDTIIAADDARFLPSLSQLFTAPWDLGIRNTKKIMFENRFILADEAKSLGLVSEVVPRADFEAAVMDQAERYAANDLLTLRFLKQSINGAQDAMGYRRALHAHHSAYMVVEMGRRAEGKDKSAPRQLTGVGAALAKTGKAEA